MLEAQIDEFKNKYEISPIQALNNPKYKLNQKNPQVLKKLRESIPIWAEKFNDMGPLIHAYDSRLKLAYRKILEGEYKIGELEDALKEKELTANDSQADLANRIKNQNYKIVMEHQLELQNFLEKHLKKQKI